MKIYEFQRFPIEISMKFNDFQWFSVRFTRGTPCKMSLNTMKIYEIPRFPIEISMKFNECHRISTFLGAFYKGYPLQNVMKYNENLWISKISHWNFDEIQWISLNFDDFRYVLQGVPLARCHEIQWNQMRCNNIVGIAICNGNALLHYNTWCTCACPTYKGKVWVGICKQKQWMHTTTAHIYLVNSMHKNQPVHKYI